MSSVFVYVRVLGEAGRRPSLVNMKQADHLQSVPTMHHDAQTRCIGNKYAGPWNSCVVPQPSTGLEAAERFLTRLLLLLRDLH